MILFIRIIFCSLAPFLLIFADTPNYYSRNYYSSFDTSITDLYNLDSDLQSISIFFIDFLVYPLHLLAIELVHPPSFDTC